MRNGRPPGCRDAHRRCDFGPCPAAPSGFTVRSGRTGRAIPVFCRMAAARFVSLLAPSTVLAFAGSLRPLCPLLTSPARSRALRLAQPGFPYAPKISRDKIDRLPRAPAELPPRPLMTVDFAVIGALVRPGRPHLRFLSIGSRFCFTLPSDPALRRRPCASLALRRHRAGQRTSTSKLSIMLGTPKKGRPERRPQRE